MNSKCHQVSLTGFCTRQSLSILCVAKQTQRRRCKETNSSFLSFYTKHRIYMNRLVTFQKAAFEFSNGFRPFFSFQFDKPPRCSSCSLQATGPGRQLRSPAVHRILESLSCGLVDTSQRNHPAASICNKKIVECRARDVLRTCLQSLHGIKNAN
jgi:hypothetical protein